MMFDGFLTDLPRPQWLEALLQDAAEAGVEISERRRMGTHRPEYYVSKAPSEDAAAFFERRLTEQW